MTTLRSIGLLNRKGNSAPHPRPVIKTGVVTPEIDQVFLENPTPELLKSYRSSQWKVAFENFSVVATVNGLRTHHFIRLEKEVSVASLAQ